jgi:hypothetical protein
MCRPPAKIEWHGAAIGIKHPKFTMHRYPTRFATMNRSYFPSDNAEWLPEEDEQTTTLFNTRKRDAEEDEEYVPEADCDDDADSYDAYVSSTSKASALEDCNDLLEDAADGDYEVNLRGWNTSMGRRPHTRSMTRSAATLNTRVASLRSSRR